MTNEIETIPNPKNFCGGNFQDWLEVYLTGKCNGKCSFCIDKHGFRPDNSIEPEELVKTIIDGGQKNILLLGGEPTLYKGFGYVTRALKEAGRNVTVTTNGSTLSRRNIKQALQDVSCVNISVHHYDLSINKTITGIGLNDDCLYYNSKSLKDLGVDVRINCNIIKGYIDSEPEALKFLNWSFFKGIRNVRFAELKNDDRFVSLASIFKNRYGLNEDPFILGCWQNADIDGMKVNFRQLCGMQTNKRAAPINPKQILKKVLYYDGKLYDGWQSIKEGDMAKDKGKNVSDEELKTTLKVLLNQVEEGNLSADEAANIVFALMKSNIKVVEKVVTTGSGCVY